MLGDISIEPSAVPVKSQVIAVTHFRYLGEFVYLAKEQRSPRPSRTGPNKQVCKSLLASCFPNCQWTQKASTIIIALRENTNVLQLIVGHVKT